MLHVPLGNNLARVYTASAHGRVEMLIFRLGRIDPDADQRWPVYLTSLLAFSAVGVGGLYLLLRVQGHLPYSLGHRIQAAKRRARGYRSKPKMITIIYLVAGMLPLPQIHTI